MAVSPPPTTMTFAPIFGGRPAFTAARNAMPFEDSRGVLRLEMPMLAGAPGAAGDEYGVVSVAEQRFGEGDAPAGDDVHAAGFDQADVGFDDLVGQAVPRMP